MARVYGKLAWYEYLALEWQPDPGDEIRLDLALAIALWIGARVGTVHGKTYEPFAQKWIAERFGISRQTVNLYIAYLEHERVIERYRCKKGQQPRYVLRYPDGRPWPEKSVKQGRHRVSSGPDTLTGTSPLGEVLTAREGAQEDDLVNSANDDEPIKAPNVGDVGSPSGRVETSTRSQGKRTREDEPDGEDEGIDLDALSPAERQWVIENRSDDADWTSEQDQ